MQKYLSIPLLLSGNPNQLVSANDVVLVYSLSSNAKKTFIQYASGIVVEIVAEDQTNYSMRTAIEDAIVAALSTPWQSVVYTVTPPVQVDRAVIYVAP